MLSIHVLPSEYEIMFHNYMKQMFYTYVCISITENIWQLVMFDHVTARLNSQTVIGIKLVLWLQLSVYYWHNILLVNKYGKNLLFW
jgi:hypothetical protein